MATGLGGAARRLRGAVRRAGGEDAARYGRWRALCAEGKADHVAALAGALAGAAALGGRGGLRRRRAARGCWRAARLGETAPRLRDLRAGGRDRAAAAGDRAWWSASTARRCRRPTARTTSACCRTCSSTCPTRLPLLRETARVCRAPWWWRCRWRTTAAASRPEAERGREAIGHLHRFIARATSTRCARTAGLRVVAELADPLPLKVHTFCADGRRRAGEGAGQGGGAPGVPSRRRRPGPSGSSRCTTPALLVPPSR